MTKSGLSKHIIIGLILSLVFGFIGNFMYKKIKLEKNKNFYKELYVLDVNKNEKTSKIRNIGVINYTKFISDQFYSSLGYSLSMFKRINTSSACKSISIQSSDNSIIIESGAYEESEKENLNSCLSKIISESFERFREKLTIVIEDEVMSKQVTLNNLRLEIEKIRLAGNEEEKFEEYFCKDIDKLYENVIEGVNLSLENDKTESLIGKYLVLDNFITWSNKCKKYLTGYGSDKESRFNSEIDRLSIQIEEIKSFIENIDEFFNINKSTIKIGENRRERYLTQTQTSLTFSILGFIVGFILSSNFLATLKRKKK